MGMAPSEYWQASPSELAILLEEKRPKHVGGIHENDIADMLSKRAELEQSGVTLL